MTSIFWYPKKELKLDLFANGFKKYLAQQIFDLIYVKNIFILMKWQIFLKLIVINYKNIIRLSH